MRTEIYNNGERIPLTFTNRLPAPLQTGDEVVVVGQSISGRWAVNLGEGPDYNSNVWLHYSIRPDQNTTVRNTKVDGSWKNEERDGGMPFAAGQDFELRIVVQTEGYECFVNGEKHCFFKHRGDLSKNAHLFIKEDGENQVDIYSVTIGRPRKGADSTDVPVTYPIKAIVGQNIYVSGVPKPDGARFNINLSTKGGDAFTTDEVALTFDIRFKYGVNRDVVVMNSLTGGAWGNEERPSGFPFKYGEFFSVLIHVKKDKFKIMVNDHPFTEYAHRLPLSSIKFLNVREDVVARCVSDY